jgi:Fe-S-cluster containining protein
MKDFFAPLKELYEHFDREYSNTDGTCIGCWLCCTSEFTYPHISALELDFLEDFTKKHNLIPIERFKHFLIHRDSPFCPYFEESRGCTAHPARPMFCRLYGNFLFEGAPELPEPCMFKGKSIYVPIEERHTLIKYVPEFRILKYKYEFYKSGNEEKMQTNLLRIIREYIRQEKIQEAFLVFNYSEKLLPKNSIIKLITNLYAQEGVEGMVSPPE